MRMYHCGYFLKCVTDYRNKFRWWSNGKLKSNGGRVTILLSLIDFISNSTEYCSEYDKKSNEFKLGFVEAVKAVREIILKNYCD